MTTIPTDVINGRYEVLSVVGRGGEGTVLRARDQRHDRLVALKRRGLPSDPDESDRILLEARTLLSLRPHAGLPLARDDFFEDGYHYLVLDWVDGVDLASFLVEHGRPGLPLATVLRWLAPVAEALTFLHGSEPPIVHGDVKPANLILTTSGQVVLVDFGVSSARGAEARGGTPGFRAPEVVSERFPTRGADVYGLAATAFALLTGGPPAGVLPDWGITDSARAARLEAALRRGLAIDPARRTSTPGELVEELRAGWSTEKSPTGVLTFLSSDVVITGREWDEQPRAAIARRAEHNVLIDLALDSHHGRRVGDSAAGESATVVFEQATDALLAAIDLQRAAAAKELPVRCALDTGEGIAEAGYAGGTSARVSRLRELADPGQVLLTAVTTRLVAGDLPAGVSTVDLGAHRMAGFEQPEQLHAVAAPGIATPPDPNVPPYPGISSFQQDDRDLFFGREDVVADLLERLRHSRLVGVVGASGSGKSSLLRAGLAPLLDGAIVLTPTEHPMCSIASVPDDAPLIVDQLEELFTSCTDDDAAREFAELLIDRTGVCAVAIRADMYGLLTEHARLADAVARNHVLLGRMAREQLRRAIELPAHARGLEIERGLVDVVLADIASEPGFLPHMAHALRETWRRREGRTLTIAGYHASGGVRGALTQTAEELYAELDQDERGVFRAVLLRMVELGDGVEDTRRRIALADLRAGPAAAQASRIVSQLADSRLVTIESDSAQPAHEALLRDWPRLRAWIDDARSDLRVQRSIAEAAAEWVRAGRDGAHLLRGSRLATAAEWVGNHGEEIGPLERQFMDASEQQENDELVAAQRNTRRLRSLLTGAVILLVVAVIAGAVALVQRNRANDEARLARAKTLASQAIAAEQTALQTSLLLAAEAASIDESLDTRGSLLAALDGARHVIRFLPSMPLGTVDTVAGRDGSRVAQLTIDGMLRFFDTSTWSRVGPEIFVDSGDVTTLSVSPDRRYVAANSTGGAQVYEFDTGQLVTDIRTELAGGYWVSAFDEPGELLAGAWFGGPDIEVWDVRSGAKRGTLRLDDGDAAGGMRTVPGTSTLLVWSLNGVFYAFDLDTFERTRSVRNPDYSPLGGGDFDISPDGDRLVTTSLTNVVVMWDAATFEPVGLPIYSSGSRVGFVRFTDGGRAFIMSSDNGAIEVFETENGVRIAMARPATAQAGFTDLGDGRLLAGSVNELAVLDMGRATASGHEIDTGMVGINDAERVPGSDAVVMVGASEVQLRQLDGDVVARNDSLEVGELTDVSVAADGQSVYVVGYSFVIEDGAFTVTSGQYAELSLPQLEVMRPLAELPEVDVPRAVALSPDGSTLAIGTRFGKLVLYEAKSHTLLHEPLPIDSRAVAALAWSDDSKLVFAGGQDGVLRLVDPVRGAVSAEIELSPLAALTDVAFTLDRTQLLVTSEMGAVFVVDLATRTVVGDPLASGGTQLQAVDVSPDGAVVAALSRDGAVRLWDLASRRAIGPELAVHAESGSRVIFDADGNELYSFAQDSTVAVIELNPSVQVRTACEIAGRNLTLTEWEQFQSGERYHATCPELDDDATRASVPGGGSST